MNDLVAQMKKTIARYQMLEKGDTVIVGVSGGADSTCLFFALEQIKEEFDLTLEVVHIYHNIRKEGIKDTEYVEKLCREQGICYHFYNEFVEEFANKKGYSLEEAGRILRYRAFLEVKEKKIKEGVTAARIKIAVAHNQNDRAETMLFQLFRGSGIRGLAGMRAVRDDIIRPLFEIQRKDIETYLGQRNIKYCIDSTNSEDTYTRNKIRNKILPLAIEEISSKTISHMTNTADIVSEAESYLSEQTKNAFIQCAKVLKIEQGISIEINLAIFHTFHSYLQKQILSYSIGKIASTQKDITSTHIMQCMYLCEKKGNGRLDLPYQIEVKRQYDEMIIQKKQSKIVQFEQSIAVGFIDENQEITLQIDGIGMVSLTLENNTGKNKHIFIENQYTKWFDYDKIYGLLRFRKRTEGDCITITKQGQHQSIKKYMIQEKIPRDLRGQTWLLADDKEILWVVGYRMSQYYQIDENTKRILKVQIEED